MHQTKYQINPTHTSRKIFDENFTGLKSNKYLCKQEVDIEGSEKGGYGTTHSDNA